MKELTNHTHDLKKEEIDAYLYSLSINNYTIQDDLIVNVHENVALFNLDIKTFPIQFGTIDGDFVCNNNLLTNLKNGPKKVLGTFSCEYNLLNTLEGSPEFVGSHFIVSGNKLTNLKYLPKIIKGNLVIQGNPIESLEGFDCLFEGSLVADLQFAGSKKIKELESYYQNSHLCVSFDIIKSFEEKKQLESLLNSAKDSFRTKI